MELEKLVNRERELMQMDEMIRENVNDENLIMWWLSEGIPDGTEYGDEILEFIAGDDNEFDEICDLYYKIMEKNEEDSDEEE